MDDCIEAARPSVSAALQTKGAKLYVNQRYEQGGTVAPKHGFLWSTTESRAPAVFGRMTDTVTLQLFAPSTYELGELQDAVEFLDDYRPPDYGDARCAHWTLESKTRVPEGGGRWQVSMLYSVEYSDARKWSSS